MASALQACEALDEALHLPRQTALWHARRVRAAGLIPSTQGRPEQITSKHIAVVLLAIATSSTTVSDYVDMPCSTGGARFGETVARFIDHPNDLFEIVIDANAPGATITYRGSDRGIQTLSFEPRERRPRSGVDKQITLGPDIFINLATAIRAAPEARAGRRSLRQRYIQ